MKVSVIMPVYNERNTLRAVIDRVLSRFPRSGMILRGRWFARMAPGKFWRSCRVNTSTFECCLQAEEHGEGTALRRGIQEATGDFVLIQDADLGVRPDDYPNLLEPLIEGKADVLRLAFFSAADRIGSFYFWHS